MRLVSVGRTCLPKSRQNSKEKNGRTRKRKRKDKIDGEIKENTNKITGQ
jgi:hypothetical protein